MCAHPNLSQYANAMLFQKKQKQANKTIDLASTLQKKLNHVP